MKNLIENNVIRFISITKKKAGIFANFKAKGIKGGTSFNASISVDLSSVEVNPSEDPLETIIEASARVALKEYKKSEMQFEGLPSV